jgi:Mn-dependent DtxR family transcriptional regulator
MRERGQKPTERDGIATTAYIAREMNLRPSTVVELERRAMLKFVRELERRGLRLEDVLPSI